MNALAVEWSRPNLTQEEEEEEEEIEFTEDISADKLDEIALSLLGKLLTPTLVNLQAMKTVFMKIW